MSTKFHIKHWAIIVSKCFDQKTTFPDTHRHSRPLIEISGKCPFFCGGLELNKKKLRKQTCLESQPTFLSLSFFRK